jgi:Domain of unknown function (DUF6456)
MSDLPELGLPGWVPGAAARYLAHTEAGYSIRVLARLAGCHASTVLRQIRRIEQQRDDPLMDAALAALAAFCNHADPRTAATADPARQTGGAERMRTRQTPCPQPPDAATLDREGRRILRRLCETGAVLAVAQKMEKSVVVRCDKDGSTTRTAVVDSAIAQAMVLQDWIVCTSTGRISRYQISAAGRSALSRLMAAHENLVRVENDSGFAESQTPFGDQYRIWADKTVPAEPGQAPRSVRYNAAESPLAALARRRDRDGRRFLDDTLVNAGERLREDFELAQMGPRVAQNWDSFLTGGARGGFAPDSGAGDGPGGARARVARALADLGPGLSDVALRCCCFLEGLEMAEKRMGWSARSGKIVLRIALQRLKRYYDGLSEPDRMIG